jgi:hypothetical protein
MWRELLQQGKDVIQQFCRRLRGADRRAFQAEVAAEVCGGSPRRKSAARRVDVRLVSPGSAKGFDRAGISGRSSAPFCSSRSTDQ